MFRVFWVAERIRREKMVKVPLGTVSNDHDLALLRAGHECNIRCFSNKRYYRGGIIPQYRFMYRYVRAIPLKRAGGFARVVPHRPYRS